MSESVWGRFSAFTDQLSQLTREVIADDEEEDEDVLEENEDQETHEDQGLNGAQQTHHRHPASLEDSDEAFFGEEDGLGAADEGDEVAQLKSVIAAQKRELADRQKEWTASQSKLQKQLRAKQEEITSLQRENLQLNEVRGNPGAKDFPTSAGPGNVGAPLPARSPSIDSLQGLSEIEAEKKELATLLNQTQKENDRLKQRVALLSAEKKTDSGAEIATLQAQHQERLQKIVEAHNQDLTLLQETYQACAARLKDTDAALAEEKRRVADLERARQDLAAAQLAAKPAPPPSTDVPTDVPATQPEEHRGSEEASTIRRLKEENDGLKQRVMALQQQHDLQQDAMAKLRSQDEGTIGMMQALVTEKERLLGEREELMNIFRSFKLEEDAKGRGKTVVSLALQVGDKLKASEQQRKRVEELETLLRGAAEQKTRLAAALEASGREQAQLRGDAQRLQAELGAAQKAAQAGATDSQALADTERREAERLRQQCAQLQAEIRTAERQRERDAAEREKMQRELEMERRELDMNELRGAGENVERVQALERDKSELERSLRQLELRRREWAEKDLRWESERADLMDKQRLMEQELNQLRAGRDQHQQVLSSAEERAQKQTEQLREELIELRGQCADLKQQLDEAREALLQAGADAADAKRVTLLGSQLEEAKKKLEKANKDSERLRMHLIDSEDTHNLQLIELQKKIDALTKRLEDYEGREHQMNDVLSRYDQLTEEYKEKQIECEETAMALMNLQTVLEQFQSQKEAEVRYEIASLHKEIAAEQDKTRKLSRDLEEASKAHRRCEELERQMQKLHEELSQKSREVVKLREEAEPIRKAFEESMRRLHSAAENGKTLVDKRLVAKLVVTYFSRQSNQNEVLNIMSSILEFTEDEKIQVGLVKPKRRWLFFGGEGGQEKEAAPKDKTLADLWVEFLLQEASENAEDKQSKSGGAPSSATTAAAVTATTTPKDWERKLSQINAATSWGASNVAAAAPPPLPITAPTAAGDDALATMRMAPRPSTPLQPNERPGP